MAPVSSGNAMAIADKRVDLPAPTPLVDGGAPRVGAGEAWFVDWSAMTKVITIAEW